MVRVGSIGLFACLLVACGGNPASDADARPPWPDAAPDASTAPYVVAVTPLDGAEGVDGDVVVTVEFSEPLEPTTVGATTFTMVGPTGAVPGAVTYSGFTTVRFRPTDELTKLESYSVTIAEDVVDLDGHPLGAPYTWTFTVAERWWHRPQAVQLGNRAFYPEVGCDGAGNVMAVWLQSDGSGAADLVAARRVGSTWGAPVPLEVSETAIPQFELDLLPGGNAIVGWRQSGVWFSPYRTGGYEWGPAVEVDDGGMNPSFAMNSAGDVIVAWEWFSDVVVRHYSHATGWSAPTTVSTGLSNGATRVAMAESGDALVLWRHSQGDANELWAVEYSATTGLGAPQDLDADDTGGTTALAMLPTGEAIALWTEGGSTYELAAKRYIPGTGWSDTATLYSDPEIPAWQARVAMDAAGNATVAWIRGDPNEVVSRRFDVTTSTWEAPTTLVAIDEPEALALAKAADGQAFVAWEERRTSSGDRDIVAAHSTTDGFVASDVEDLGTSDSYSVALAACPGGTAIVLWTEEDPGALYSSEYR